MEQQESWSSFVCHAWMTDTARLVVCTDQGEILVCENSGEFYAFVEQVKQGVKCIVPFTRGFVVGWSTGLFTCYERYDDPQTTQSYYRRFKEISTFLEQPYQLTNFPISSMALTSTEDQIFFITENN